MALHRFPNLAGIESVARNRHRAAAGEEAGERPHQSGAMHLRQAGSTRGTTGEIFTSPQNASIDGGHVAGQPLHAVEPELHQISMRIDHALGMPVVPPV